MANSTLQKIETKVRRLTASPNANQLTTQNLRDQIDTFYEQELPSALKLLSLKQTLTFYTTPNEDEYDFDTTEYYEVLAPVYIDRILCGYTPNRRDFYLSYPRSPLEKKGPTGTNVLGAGPYEITISSKPILKRSVTVSAINSSDGIMKAYDRPQANDNAVGDLIDEVDNTTVLGTINYITGVGTITFSSTVKNGEQIVTRYTPYVAARPTLVLFDQNKFTLRPVPDKVYPVEVTVLQKPTQALSANSYSSSNTPDVEQWWQLIAFGAAKNILMERQDMESYQNIMVGYKEQERLVINRTAAQLGQTRSKTAYATQTSDLTYTYGPDGYWGGWF